MGTFGEFLSCLVGPAARSTRTLAAGVALLATTTGCPDSNRADLDGGVDASTDIARDAGTDAVEEAPSDVAATDASCAAPGLAVCGGACVNLVADPRHCGACDRACDVGMVCAAGLCAPPCGAPGERACTDPDGAMVCDPDATLMGARCVCPSGTTAVPGARACACPEGRLWNGAACVPCGSDLCAAAAGAQRLCLDNTCGSRCVPGFTRDARGACVRPTARPIYPPSGSYLTGRTVRLRWELPPGIDRVRVDLCATPACRAPHATSRVVTGAEVTLPVASGYGWWRIVSADGAVAMSPVWFFVARGTVDTPSARVWPGVLVDDGSRTARGDGTPSVLPLHARHGAASRQPHEFGCGAESSSQWLTAGNPGGRWETATLAGDVNGDGQVEYAIAQPLAGDGGRVLLRSPCATPAALLPDLVAPTDVARFGTSLAGHGDLDGDGYADLVALAYERATGRPVLLAYHGGAAGLATAPTHRHTLPFVVPRGVPVELRVVGDVNGDDRSDLAVALPDADHDAGRVLLWLGSATGLDPRGPVELRASSRAGARFGAAVAPAGDLDGDGLVDVAVGAPGTSTFHVFAGAATPSAMPAVTRDTIRDVGLGAQCGATLAGLGDTDGDGRSDLAVGCPRATVTGETVASGAVVLFRGRGGGAVLDDTYASTHRPVFPARLTAQSRVGFTLAARPTGRAQPLDALLVGTVEDAFAFPSRPTIGLVGGNTSAWVGFDTDVSAPPIRTTRVVSVGPAGDVDGDGRGDIALQTNTHLVFFTTSYASRGVYADELGVLAPPPIAPIFDADVNADGARDLVLRGAAGVGVALRAPWGISGRADVRLTDPDGSSASGFGGNVAAADLDGDGASDLLVSSTGGRGKVLAYLFHGGTAGPRPSSELSGAEGSVGFGARVVNLGDLNGDHRDDVAIATNDTPRRVAIVLGAATGLSATPLVTLTAAGMPGAVGDVNGDHFGDLAYNEGGTVHVLFGGATGVSAGAGVTVSTTTTSSGDFIRALGDVDGDGLGDFLAGEPNRPQLVVGDARQPTLRAASGVPAATLLEPVGDLDGDGVVDLVAAGDPNAAPDARQTIVDLDDVARIYFGRRGTGPIYDAARATSLHIGPTAYWGSGQFTP